MLDLLNISFASYVLIFAVPIFIAFIDFVVVLRVKRKHPSKHRKEVVENELDFNILIPIFGNMKYLKNIEFLSRYGDKVILCTTSKESAQFNKQIDHVVKLHGFKIFRSEVLQASKSSKVNPWRLFNHALTYDNKVDVQIKSEFIRDEIILDSFVAVKAKYCVFIDGDTVSEEPIEKIVAMFQEMEFDLSSVRVVASKHNSLAEKLQSVEYELSMDARRVYPWLTSGAAMVARTSVIKHIMRHHSLFFQGGDIEIGKLAMLLGYRVGHLHTVFFTDVPETFKAWAKQRVAWAGGGFRHSIINLHRFSWRFPFFFFYNTIIVYALIPVRMYETVMHPIVLLYVYAIYTLLIALFHWKRWKPYYLLFPAYALFQILILIPLGVLKYFQMALHARNVGHIKVKKHLKETSSANA